MASPLLSGTIQQSQEQRPVLLGKAASLSDGKTAVATPFDFSPGSTVASEVDAREVLHTARCLQLVCGAHQIPHPKKVDYGGEDSFFTSSSDSAIGVADGVSEWGWRFGLNPRDFAGQLMDGARAATEEIASAEGGPSSAQQRAARALQEGHASVKAFGAATAVIAALDPEASEVGVANLGDAGMRLLRRVPGALSHSVVGRTKEQHHAFNQPFQLSRIPQRQDFPVLLNAGKRALVEAVRRCPALKQDKPSDAELYSFAVKDGDLLILGSDGLLDNLHEAEICEAVDEAFAQCSPVQPQGLPDDDSHDDCRAGCLPDTQDLATSIAKRAFDRSQDQRSETPFSQTATKAGFSCIGGISDDITVVVAWVVAKSL